MSGWNGLDFFIFLIIAVCTIRGMARGASREIISLLCLSAALIFAIKFTIPLAAFMMRSPLIQDVLGSVFVQNMMTAIGAEPLSAGFLAELSYAISLLLCFLGVFSICEAALAKTGLVETVSFPYAAVTRKVGGSLGAVRGYVFSLVLVCAFGLHLFKSYNGPIDSELQSSFFVTLFYKPAIQLDSIISNQAVDQYTKVYQGKDLFNATDVVNTLSQPGTPMPAPTPPPAAPIAPTTP